MDKKFDFSIVIVTYNNVKIILDCLKSLSISLANFSTHVIIIDNASSDATVQVLTDCKEWLASAFNLAHIIFNNKNLGYTRAINQGLAKCHGKYVLLLNPDVIILPETISVLLKILISNKQTGVVAPQLRFADGRIQPSCRRFPRKQDILYEIFQFRRFFPRAPWLDHWQMADFDHKSSRNVDQPQGAFLLMKRQVLQDVGAFDERFFMFFSDVDWCYRVQQKGWAIHFCAETYAVHFKGASIYKNRTRMIVSSHRSFLQYFVKYDQRTKMPGTFFTYLILLIILLPRIILVELNLDQG